MDDVEATVRKPQLSDEQQRMVPLIPDCGHLEGHYANKSIKLCMVDKQ